MSNKYKSNTAVPYCTKCGKQIAHPVYASEMHSLYCQCENLYHYSYSPSPIDDRMDAKLDAILEKLEEIAMLLRQSKRRRE